MNRLLVILIFICVAASLTPGHAGEVSFTRDIRPILSDKCNFCHGPDENTREAGLRLDLRDEAADALESGELIERINSDDEDLRMPPPDSKLSLTKKEKQILKQWIDAGAPPPLPRAGPPSSIWPASRSWLPAPFRSTPSRS